MSRSAHHRRTVLTGARSKNGAGLRSRSLVLSLVLVATVLQAGDYAGYAGAFLRLGTTARSMAMGSSFTAEPDYGFMAYHNPAGVVFPAHRQITFLHHFLPLDRQFVAGSFSTALPPTAGLGLAWISSGVRDIEGRSASGYRTETLSTGEDAVFVTFANQILPGFSIGINVKVLFHRLPVDSKSLVGKGTGFDLGLMWKKWPRLTLAGMAQDFNSKYVWNTSDVFEQEGSVYNDRFPAQYRVGLSYLRTPTFRITMDLGAVLDMEAGEYLGATARLGSEWTVRDHFFIRGGFGNGRAGFGAGMQYSLLKENDAFLDYAFILEIPTGAVHVFTYSFYF